ncbi:MAG: glycosyltransferase [Candidatus Micrarchaeaceae archaeon]
MSVEISVIIPALNEEKYIKNVLYGLNRQTFRNFETIVVDGGSDDNTVRMAKRYAKVAIVKERGAGRARNAGAKLAKGKTLVFLDADTSPSENLLGTYAKIMRRRGIVAATGPIYPLEKSGGRYYWGYKLVSVFLVRLSILVGRPVFMGSNFAVRKSAFEKAHGFREDMLSYEDWELSARLKKQGIMAYSSKAWVQTSIRRVKKWGMARYFLFYTTNFLRFHIFKESHRDYQPVR